VKKYEGSGGGDCVTGSFSRGVDDKWSTWRLHSIPQHCRLRCSRTFKDSREGGRTK